MNHSEPARVQQVPQTQDAGFSINLFNPNRGYRPSNKLEGEVIAWHDPSYSDPRPKVVHITLEGRSKSKIQINSNKGSATTRARIPLVYRFGELKPADPAPDPQGGYGYGGDGYGYQNSCTRYPFTIAIPGAIQDLSGESAFADEQYWTHSLPPNKVVAKTGPGGALPSTLAFGPRGAVKRIEGYVEYKLVAVESLVSYAASYNQTGAPTGQLEPVRSAQRGLWLIGLNADSMLTAQFSSTSQLECKTNLLSDISVPGFRTSFAARASRIRSGIKVPPTKCSVTRSGPKALWVGQPFDITVSLGPPEGGPASVPPHEISIENIRIVLKRRVGIAARNDFTDEYYETILDQTASPPHLNTYNNDPTNLPARVSRNPQGYESINATFGPTPEGIGPSAYAGNISYRYETTLHVRVRYAGEIYGQKQPLYLLVGYMSVPQKALVMQQQINASFTPLSPVTSAGSTSGSVSGSGSGTNKIKRKPVGSAAQQQPQQPPQVDMSTIPDELSDLGPYQLDPDDVELSKRVFHNTLRGLHYASTAYKVLHHADSVANWLS